MDPSRRLLDSITRAHERFVHDGDRRVAFDLLLEDLLALTESEYGFIGEVLPVAPNDETRRLVAERGGAGLAFHDLDDLFGAAIRTGAMVVSNDPASDPRNALSSGPPFLRSFLGLPVRVGDRLVGMVGLANRPGGYDEALARSLDPLLATCATLIDAWRIDVARTRAEAALVRRRALDEIVLRMSGLLFTERDRLDEAIERTLGELATLVGAERASYFRSNPDGVTAMRCYRWGREVTREKARGTVFEESFPTSAIPWLMRSLEQGRAVFVPDLASPPPEAAAELQASVRIGGRSQAWLPAHADDRVVGAISLLWIDRKAVVDESDLSALSVIADLIASALQRRHAELALRRRHEIDALVLDLSSRFLDLPVEQVDGAIVAGLGRIAKLAGADRAILTQVSSDGERLVRTHVFGEEMARQGGYDGVIPMALLPEAAQVFAVRRAGILPIASIPTDSPVGAAMAALGVDHLAWLSATEHERPAGAVVLYWRHSPIRIDPVDLEGLSVVADLLTAVLRRRDADIALRDSEARFRVMADSSPLLIWVYDLRGKLVFANRACELFTRRSGPGLLATGPSMPVHPAERVALADAFRRAAETGTSFEIECRAQRGDGQWRSLLVSAAPLVGADGAARGFVGSSLDLTDRKRLEEELRQALKLEAVGRLAGGIAHDFNNLLTAVVGHVACARETIAGGGFPLRDLDEIDAASNRAASLTRQLLAFARRQMIELRVVDTNQLVTGVEQLLRRLIGEHVRLEVKLAPAAGHVRVDPGQLEQVLINLAINARDAMPAGGRLWIETGRVAESAAAGSAPDAGWVRIAVADTGAGMDDETLAHAFEPFFTTKEVGKGTGLGLATCYGIVTQSQGHISVYSEVGVGTTFEILLPAVAEAPISAERAGASSVDGSRGRETILLVEDEAAVRRLAARILRGLGYQVIEATDGQHAMQLADAGPFDLLLTDMVMPGKGGPEVAAWARGIWPGVRVLYISGYTDSFAAEVTGERDFHFLAKPFTPQQLASRVRGALDAPALPA